MRAGLVVVGFGISLLAMGALADMALGKPEAISEPRPVLRLVWVDVDQAAHTIRSAVHAETRAVLDRAGVDVQWEIGDGEARLVEDGEVQVVVLASHPPRMRREVMGAARPSLPGARTVWVFLAGVRRALGMADTGRGPMAPRDVQPLGRAVARVILHEVVHATAPAWPHAPRGLMSGRLRRATLLGADLALEPPLHDVFRAAATGTFVPATMAAAGGRIPEMLEQVVTD